MQGIVSLELWFSERIQRLCLSGRSATAIVSIFGPASRRVAVQVFAGESQLDLGPLTFFWILFDTPSPIFSVTSPIWRDGVASGRYSEAGALRQSHRSVSHQLQRPVPPGHLRPGVGPAAAGANPHEQELVVGLGLPGALRESWMDLLLGRTWVLLLLYWEFQRHSVDPPTLLAMRLRLCLRNLGVAYLRLAVSEEGEKAQDLGTFDDLFWVRGALLSTWHQKRRFLEEIDLPGTLQCHVDGASVSSRPNKKRR